LDLSAEGIAQIGLVAHALFVIKYNLDIGLFVYLSLCFLARCYVFTVECILKLYVSKHTHDINMQYNARHINHIFLRHNLCIKFCPWSTITPVVTFTQWRGVSVGMEVIAPLYFHTTRLICRKKDKCTSNKIWIDYFSNRFCHGLTIT